MMHTTRGNFALESNVRNMLDASDGASAHKPYITQTPVDFYSHTHDDAYDSWKLCDESNAWNDHSLSYVYTSVKPRIKA